MPASQARRRLRQFFLGVPSGLLQSPELRLWRWFGNGFAAHYAQVYARTHVHEGQLIEGGLPILKGKHAGFAKVISVQEFVQGVPLPNKSRWPSLALHRSDGSAPAARDCFQDGSYHPGYTSWWASLTASKPCRWQGFAG